MCKTNPQDNNLLFIKKIFKRNLQKKIYKSYLFRQEALIKDCRIGFVERL